MNLSSIIAITLFLTAFIAGLLLWHQHNQTVIARKRARISALKSQFNNVEDVIEASSQLPLSEATLFILNSKQLQYVTKLCEELPREKAWKLHKERLVNILSVLSTEDNPAEGIPSCINDDHMLQCVRVLKNVHKILVHELHQDRAYSSVISREIAKTRFYILHLSVSALLKSADEAMTINALGSARERYESALVSLGKYTGGIGVAWVHDTVNYCKEQLRNISDNMRQSNQNFVRTNKIANDETGLSRMMDGKKHRLA